MKKYQVGIIGSYDRENAKDGQTVKTLEIFDSLIKHYGKDNVNQLSYHAIRNSKIKLLKLVLSGFLHTKTIIVMTTCTGIPNLLRACTIINRFFKRRLYFILIGGELPEINNTNKKTVEVLDGIFVETKTIYRNLALMGVNNIHLLSNFKNIRLYTEDEIPKDFTPPYRLIYMSRIVAMKGVSEMIETIKEINKDNVKYTLDIYGKFYDEYENEFKSLLLKSPDYIQYKGVANAWETTDIMHDYFLHLFPTKYLTEGQPASILDSFFSGVPVLAARWESCYDMLEEKVTGITFELGNFDEMKEKLIYIYDNPGILTDMRKACLKEAQKYLPENIMKEFLEVIEKPR